MRIEGWRAPLATELDRIARTPFAWGTHDCLVGLVAPCVMVLTGQDVAARWRGRYSSLTGAVRVMRNDGFADLDELIGSVLLRLEHPSRAQVGDVVAMPGDDALGVTLGILNSERVIGLGQTGTATVDRAQAIAAFRVG